MGKIVEVFGPTIEIFDKRFCIYGMNTLSNFRLPADVKNAIIQVCGRSFWYKQPLFDMFARAGIPENLYLKYEQERKRGQSHFLSNLSLRR